MFRARWLQPAPALGRLHAEKPVSAGLGGQASWPEPWGERLRPYRPLALPDPRREPRISSRPGRRTAGTKGKGLAHRGPSDTAPLPGRCGRRAGTWVGRPKAGEAACAWPYKSITYIRLQAILS